MSKPNPEYEGQILLWDTPYKATNKRPEVNDMAFYVYRETYKAVNNEGYLSWQLQYDFNKQENKE